MSQKPPAPVFSSIIAASGNAEALARTQSSLETQTCRAFERIVAETGRGRSEALNDAMARAQGDYLLFLNAGDTLASPDILAELEKYALKTPDMMYGDALEKGRAKKPYYSQASSARNLRRGMFTPHQAIFYRRETVRALSLHYSLRYDFAADYDFTARFLAHSSKIAYLPRPITLCDRNALLRKLGYAGRREQYLIRDRLALCSQPENVLIFLRQGLSRRMRTLFPWVGTMVKKIAL